MLRTAIGTALLMTLTGPVLAVSPDLNWRTGALPDGTPLAQNNVERKRITMTCIGNKPGGHKLVYEVPREFINRDFYNSKPSTVDLVLYVDQHGGVDADYVASFKASVSEFMGEVSYSLEGANAWDLMSSIAYSEWVTIAVSPAFDPKAPRLYAVTSYRTGGTSEVAMGGVLGPCAPAN